MTALRKTPVALISGAAPFAIRSERASDVVAREALLDACFGANRRQRTCQRLRDGRAPGELRLPGPFEPDRLLGLELREGALDGASGMIVPTGMAAPLGKPRLAARLRKLAPRAA